MTFGQRVGIAVAGFVVGAVIAIICFATGYHQGAGPDLLSYRAGVARAVSHEITPTGGIATPQELISNCQFYADEGFAHLDGITSVKDFMAGCTDEARDSVTSDR